MLRAEKPDLRGLVRFQTILQVLGKVERVAGGGSKREQSANWDLGGESKPVDFSGDKDD